MLKILSSKAEVVVNLQKGVELQRENLWIHIVDPSSPGKVLAKGKVGKDNRAVISFQFKGTEIRHLNAIVSPLSNLKNLKYLVNQAIELKKWSEKEGNWYAFGEIELTNAFKKSVDWLNEEFVVNGILVNQYIDPETEMTVENPVRHGLVKLFDVDKRNLISTNCKPDLITCLPATICKPIKTCLPADISVCKPALACSPIDMGCIPKITCSPRYICTPTREPACGPWVYDEPIDMGDIREDIIKYSIDTKSSGCCGSSATESVKIREVAVPSPVMKPISSPALTGKNGLGLSVENGAFKVCRPVIMDAFSKYKKTQLGTEFETEDDGRFSFVFKRIDFFEAPAPTTHTENIDWDEFPDLLFQARLWIDNDFRLIYDEPYTDTRWDQGTNTFVKLIVNGRLPECDPADTDIDPYQTAQFLFHGIGDVEPGWISNDGVIKSAPVATGLNEYVFGGSMEINGQFSSEHSGKYYQVEYQRDGEADWHPMLGEQWSYSRFLGDGKWKSLVKTPTSYGEFAACYEIPDYTDHYITQKTHLITWSSYRNDGNVSRYPNGVYHIRVRLLELVEGVMKPVSGFNPNENVLNVRIDNNWPVANISPSLYVGDLSGSILNISGVSECGLINRGIGKYLIIKFNAEDLENHFLLYNLKVNRGADQSITIPDSGLPEGVTTNPSLSNFEIQPSYYRFEDVNDNFHNAYCAMNLGVDPWLPLIPDSNGHISPQPLRPCAYNFTLSVYDRVTNGKGIIHYSQHTMTLTVL